MSTDMPAPAPRIQRREAWIDMPDAYAGLRVRVWLSAPQKLWTDIAGDDEARTRAALARVVLEHNGWLDEDGQPLPPATDPAFWDLLPAELIVTLLTVCQTEMLKLPNSLAPKKRR